MDGFVVTFGDDCSGVLVLQVCFGTNLMDTPCELVRKVAPPHPVRQTSEIRSNKLPR